MNDLPSSAPDAFPPRLVRLWEASERWDFFAGSFEFVPDGHEAALDWFADEVEPASRFVVFGHDSTGGLYAFWLIDGCSPPEAPVVHLGGEGECSVLAVALDDFLALLALDVQDLGVIDGDFEPEPGGTPDHDAYMAWFSGEGLVTVDDPDSLVAAARYAHPGLADFVERAMAGERIEPNVPRVRAPSARDAPVTELPSDPVRLLGAPRPQVKLSRDAGVELRIGDDGLVNTVFITPGIIGSRLRPAGLNVFALGRAGLVEAFGPPNEVGERTQRFDRGNLEFHAQFSEAGAIEMVTLMWTPALPDSSTPFGAAPREAKRPWWRFWS